jgi:small subunit ribosomal protein S1
MTHYLPEGGSASRGYTLSSLQEAQTARSILEARCIVCDSRHNLIVDLGCMRGIIPREEGAIGISEGSTKDIALISRVNKPVCFVVTGFEYDEENHLCAILSRKQAQLACRNGYLAKLAVGDIIPARVTHLEQFGCFVDIGCGVPSLIPIDLISVSRISHPSDRFYVGQDIRAVVKSVEDGRINLTHKELLGTWEQNSALFEAGETVTGIVRSIEDYGIFVELTPNLAGLAEPKSDVSVNSRVSVYIKAIIPDKMKVKLIIVNSFDEAERGGDFRYFIESGHIDKWVYSCKNSPKLIQTEFI